MPNVSLMTLNLHCLVEDHLPDKQQVIVDYIVEKDIDIICFQEVAQTQTKEVIIDQIKEDNYILTLQRILQEKGKNYQIYYEPFKQSFGRYDEGLGYLSKYPLTLHTKTQISTTSSYQDWHRRYVLTYQGMIGDEALYIANTHFGWSEGNERFEDQFDQAKKTLPKNELGLLVGDYNVIPDSTEYQYIMAQGMIDLFDVESFRHQPTHFDGDKIIRIDYMMSTIPVQVLHQELAFTQERVSDHAGLYLELEVK